MRLRTFAVLLLALPLFAERAPATKVEIRSKVLGTAPTVLVSLPEGYGRAKEPYPVLYMTDGAKHLDFTIAAIDALADVDRMPPLIVVAIPHADRTRELTPTHVEKMMREGAMQSYPTSGGGRDFERFVSDELIPAIEARYRTAPYRIFAGHSFGGLFGVDLLAAKPALFQAWLIVSPDVAWDDGFLFRRVNEVPAGARTTVILMHGNEGNEVAAGVERIRALLNGRGIDVAALSFPDDDHITAPMVGYYTGLRRVFAPWFFRILDGDDPDEASVQIVKHYEELSARYGYRIAIPEHRLQRIRNLRW
jgi:uncharacterized protein